MFCTLRYVILMFLEYTLRVRNLFHHREIAIQPRFCDSYGNPILTQRTVHEHETCGIGGVLWRSDEWMKREASRVSSV